MNLEKTIVNYVLSAKYDDLPVETINIAKLLLMTELSSIVAGASSKDCEIVMGLVKEWGGKEEAKILVHDVSVPACNAALVNGIMGRVLDFEEALIPGIHITPVMVPAAIAASELIGGCTGKEFLTSLVLGFEMGCRINNLNLIDHVGTYPGFDPTGICSIFAGTIAAARILKLSSVQLINALGLAFNRSAGTFQSYLDGAQTISFTAGNAAQGSVLSVQLAQRGLTGPRHFLTGKYGYINNYANGNADTQALVGELGKRFELNNTIFKKFPSCGLTQTSTQAILELVDEEGITAKDVSEITVWLQPFTSSQVGHFTIGESPRQDAQFSVQYCIANALIRKSSMLHHFDEPSIRDPEIITMVEKIKVVSEPEMEKRDQTSVDMELKTVNGKIYRKSIDSARGFPGNRMNKEEHIERFQQCVNYGYTPWSQEKVNRFLEIIENFEKEDDVRIIVGLLSKQ